MNNKTKLAFVCHPYHRGGVTRWMADAAIAFASSGHEVYFITVEPVKPFSSARNRETLLELLSKEKNTVTIIKATVGYEFEFGTEDYRAFVYKKLIARLPPGTPLILSDDYANWEAATSLNAAYPIIGVLHADEKHYYGLAQKYAHAADLLVCVSERVSRTVKKLAPQFDSSHVFTIPCGINLPATPTTTGHGNILQLVYVGRLTNFQKRVADLGKICALLVNEKIEFHLDIIGDGVDRAALENDIVAAGLQRYVTFSGWLSQSDVAQHLSQSDILLLTSDFEGTPIAMMEAFAAGCGMVGTRVSGIEDIESHPLAADCLAVYDVGDVDDAVARINKLAAIPVPVRQQAARNIAETEFSMEVCMKRYLSAIALIKPRSAACPAITMSIADRLYSKTIAVARKLKVSLLHRA
jgi:glycosyltransferase involved in cell wall biosynthesis